MSDSPSKEPSFEPPTLDDLLEGAWRELDAAVADGRHGWHLMMVASSPPEAAPDVRTVVLRSVDPVERLVSFHTDLRSSKVPTLVEQPKVGVLWYDKDRRIQLRGTASATVHHDDDVADEAWSRSSLSSRRCYLAPHAPSISLADFSANLPGDLLHQAPDQGASEAGRSNFAVVRCHLESIDWLHLRHDGHVRARFSWDGDAVEAEWLAP